MEGAEKKPEGQEFLIIYYLFPGLLSFKESGQEDFWEKIFFNLLLLFTCVLKRYLKGQCRPIGMVRQCHS
jgi:hypothetical protein